MQWLSDNKIPFTQNMLKPELYKLVQTNKPLENPYKIDSILRNHVHIVIRLPPYHPDLNPANYNTSFDNKNIINLTRQVCESIGKENWTAACERVIKIEDEYLEREVFIDEMQDRVLINLGDYDNDDDDDEDYLSSEDSYPDNGSHVSDVEAIGDSEIPPELQDEIAGLCSQSILIV